MSDWKDSASSKILQVTNILLLFNPYGTAMGALCGVSFKFIVNLFAPFVTFILTIKSSGVDLLESVCFFIFSFNIRSYIRRDKVSKKTRELLLLIEEQELAGRITKVQARIKYLEVINAELLEKRPKFSSQSAPQPQPVE